jgi:NADH dehydrogenase FAD-containing subunit
LKYNACCVKRVGQRNQLLAARAGNSNSDPASFFYFAIQMIRTVQKHHRLIRPVFKNAFNRRCLATVAHDLENAYDVVIIGGGVAGVTLACSLGK